MKIKNKFTQREITIESEKELRKLLNILDLVVENEEVAKELSKKEYSFAIKLSNFLRFGD